jgi:hypothetical protein
MQDLDMRSFPWSTPHMTNGHRSRYQSSLSNVASTAQQVWVGNVRRFNTLGFASSRQKD